MLALGLGLMPREAYQAIAYLTEKEGPEAALLAGPARQGTIALPDSTLQSLGRSLAWLLVSLLGLVQRKLTYRERADPTEYATEADTQTQSTRRTDGRVK